MATTKISGDLSYYDGTSQKSLASEIRTAKNAANAAQQTANDAMDAIENEVARAQEAEGELQGAINDLASQLSQVYGVSIDKTDSNPYTCVTYTDSAAGFTPAAGNNGNYQRGTIEDKFPYNAIKPCLFQNGAVVGYLNPNNFYEFEDGSSADIYHGYDGDVMIEIPHFYYKIAHNGTTLEVKISNAPGSGFTDAAFSYNGVVKDKIYIGAYLGYVDGNNRLRSIASQSPTGGYTIGQFRTLAQNNGNGYEQMQR